MSDAKFAAAKELIQEKKYDEARTILKTINDPKATKWLTRIDEIAPAKPTRIATKRESASPKSSEAEEFYQAQNKKRRRKKLGNGIELTIMGVVMTAIGIGFSSPTIGGVAQAGSTSPLNGLLFLGGIVVAILGLVTIARRKNI